MGAQDGPLLQNRGNEHPMDVTSCLPLHNIVSFNNSLLHSQKGCEVGFLDDFTGSTRKSGASPDADIF